MEATGEDSGSEAPGRGSAPLQVGRGGCGVPVGQAAPAVAWRHLVGEGTRLRKGLPGAPGSHSRPGK